MSKVDGDPESMKSLAQAVKDFAEEVESAVSKLNSAVGASEEGWPDDNGAKARDAAQEMLAKIDVSEEAEDIATNISQKADSYSELLGG